MKSNNSITSFSIFSNLKRVIDEVGEDRVLALIAHHEPEQFYKTIKFSLFNKNIRLCTRCTGIYLGIITTILYLLFSLSTPEILMPRIIYTFPIPAMLDWGLEKYGIYKGNNATRFVSGFMLGICYVFLWTKFIQNPFDIEVWLIAIFYVIIAYFVLKYSSRKTA
jgi:uncharacterized membrane protein